MNLGAGDQTEQRPRLLGKASVSAFPKSSARSSRGQWQAPQNPRPNPSLNRTRNGLPGSGFTSFSPKPVTPPRAG